MTFFSAIFTSITGASLSDLVSVISAVAALPASSVALIWSLPSSESLSQELTVLAEPSFGVKVSSTLQVEDTSSFQDATASSPIFISLPEMMMAGPAMTLTELLAIVMTGALVSFVGVGGLGSTGVTGVGSTGSGSQQETAENMKRETNRAAEKLLNHLISINNSLVGMPLETVFRGSGSRPLAEGR
jgi:hypothetical protein